jgi:hypothetical protein
VLNQDFRAATFCLRPDDEKDGFRFAHTSLYEYFGSSRNLVGGVDFCCEFDF